MQEKVTSMCFSVSAEFPENHSRASLSLDSLHWKFHTNTEAHAGYL